MTRTNSAGKGENGISRPTPPAANELKFEAALAELEQIVRTMEDGRLPLEESIAAYRRGSELLRHCQQQLGDAERKIQVLEDGSLRDFDANLDPVGDTAGAAAAGTAVDSTRGEAK